MDRDKPNSVILTAAEAGVGERRGRFAPVADETGHVRVRLPNKKRGEMEGWSGEGVVGWVGRWVGGWVGR